MQRVVTQYKTLFERAPVLMNAFDRHNRCVLWNAECEKVFGWSMTEIGEHPDPLALFYPDPEERQRVQESVRFAPLKDMYEWHPVRKDGTPLTILWSNILYRITPFSILASISPNVKSRTAADRQSHHGRSDGLSESLDNFTAAQNGAGSQFAAGCQ